jgi:hypothetical protein
MLETKTRFLLCITWGRCFPHHSGYCGLWSTSEARISTSYTSSKTWTLAKTTRWKFTTCMDFPRHNEIVVSKAWNVTRPHHPGTIRFTSMTNITSFSHKLSTGKKHLLWSLEPLAEGTRPDTKLLFPYFQGASLLYCLTQWRNQDCKINFIYTYP